MREYVSASAQDGHYATNPARVYDFIQIPRATTLREYALAAGKVSALNEGGTSCRARGAAADLPGWRSRNSDSPRGQRRYIVLRSILRMEAR